MTHLTEFDAEHELEKSLLKHGDVLSVLIAENAIWAHPDIHEQLVQAGNPAKYPHIRRAKKGEIKGQNINGTRLDDNTYANNAIKWALGGRKKFKGYTVCHVWEKTCYSEKYHTVIANLVLLPRALESLTDHHSLVKNILQYRAYALYKWHPENCKTPTKPHGYDNLTWRKIEKPVITRTRKPVTKKSMEGRVTKSITSKIEAWATKPNSNVHKIIGLVKKKKGIKRNALIKEIEFRGLSKNPSGAISSLMTNAGNSYGCIFETTANGRIYFTAESESIIEKFVWSI